MLKELTSGYFTNSGYEKEEDFWASYNNSGTVVDAITTTLSGYTGTPRGCLTQWLMDVSNAGTPADCATELFGGDQTYLTYVLANIVTVGIFNDDDTAVRDDSDALLYMV